MAGQLALPCWLVRWFVGWLVRSFVGLLVDRLVGRLAFHLLLPCLSNFLRKRTDLLASNSLRGSWSLHTGCKSVSHCHGRTLQVWAFSSPLITPHYHSCLLCTAFPGPSFMHRTLLYRQQIPAGTQSQNKLRLSGRGIPRLNGMGKGDHYVTFNIHIPK